MKKKLLALVLLSAVSAPACALDDSGVYLVGMAGNTSNIAVSIAGLRWVA
jgi:hypothetical protein